MKAEENENPNARDLLTKQQAAAYLQISQRTLSYWMERKLVSFIRIGRSVRFRRADLETIGTMFEKGGTR